jgi:hypothetical protein
MDLVMLPQHLDLTGAIASLDIHRSEIVRHPFTSDSPSLQKAGDATNWAFFVRFAPAESAIRSSVFQALPA